MVNTLDMTAIIIVTAVIFIVLFIFVTPLSKYHFKSAESDFNIY